MGLTMVHLTSLERVEDSRQFGWRWVLEYENEDGGRWVQEYATDPRGEGLFVRIVDGPSVRWDQLKGTLQFHVDLGDRHKALRQICRHFKATDITERAEA